MTEDTLEAIELIPILEPTALRTNPLYSIYFNWFRFIAIGVMPFGLLVSFVSFEQFKSFDTDRTVGKIASYFDIFEEKG